MNDEKLSLLKIPMELPVRFDETCRQDAIGAALRLAVEKSEQYSCHYQVENGAFEIRYSTESQEHKLPAKLFLFPDSNGFLVFAQTDLKVIGLKKTPLACFTNRVNAKLRLGNFEFASNDSFISFRLMQLCLDSLPSPRVVLTCLNTVIGTLNRYVPEFQAVAEGRKSSATAIEDAMKRTKDNNWTLKE